MAHSQANVQDNAFWVTAHYLIAMQYACDDLKVKLF